MENIAGKRAAHFPLEIKINLSVFDEIIFCTIHKLIHEN